MNFSGNTDNFTFINSEVKREARDYGRSRQINSRYLDESHIFFYAQVSSFCRSYQSIGQGSRSCDTVDAEVPDGWTYLLGDCDCSFGV